MSSLLATTVRDLLDRLASDAPTPGGGAVAALAAALASDLARMVCRLTLAGRRFADRRPQIQPILERLTRAAQALRMLIDEDAQAYAALAEALRRPRDDPARPREVATAAAIAARVPLEVALLARQVARDAAALEPLANPNLAADVRVAGYLAEAARRSGAELVRANLPLLAQSDRERIEHELAHILPPREPSAPAQ